MNVNINEFLLDRIRNILQKQGANWEEKKMFGGMCFMVNHKMCLGTFKGGLMARTGPEEAAKLIELEGAEQMFQRDRPMKGYVFVDPPAYEEDEQLEFWIVKCLEFNPFAKASKKKKSKKKKL